MKGFSNAYSQKNPSGRILSGFRRHFVNASWVCLAGLAVGQPNQTLTQERKEKMGSRRPFNILITIELVVIICFLIFIG